MNFEIKKIFFILLFLMLILSSALFVSRVFCYDDQITHPAFTVNIANVYNQNNENKLSNEEINWLRQGSIEEDMPIRWMNHFYEPNINKGIWGFSASKDWAQNSALQSTYLGMKGDQTWQKAIDFYAKGDNKSAFIALGHILHLLEDATVPAHTRLDAHPEGDPYEVWTKNTIQNNIEFNVQPANPDNLSDAFYQLANYSNKNFFSGNTLLNKKTLDSFERFYKAVDGRTVKCLKGVVGSCLLLVKKEFGEDVYFLNDPIVHADYFNLLGPKAVAYGAGAIKLFFDEAEKKKQQEEQKNWWDKIKNWFNSQASNFSGSLLGLSGSSANPLTSSGNNTGNNSGENQNSANSQAGLNRLIYPQLGQDNEENQNIFNNGIVSVLPLFAPQISSNSPVHPGNINDDSSSQVSSEDNPLTSSGNNLDGSQQITSQFFPPEQSGENEFEENGLSDENSSTSSENNNLNPGSSDSSASGSRSADSSAAEIDIQPPETYATSTLFSANSVIATTTAVFDFSSSETDSIFKCSLDNATSTICASAQAYENLSEGAHNFQVQAIDLAGNQDATPAIINWTIDTTLPIISNIAITEITRSSAKINFTTNEPTYGKVGYGTTTLYGLETIWESATSTSHSILLSGLYFNSVYYFQISTKDNAGNITNSTGQNFTTSAQADHIVISEFATGGAGGANDEWIELYNPTSQAIDLSNYSIQYRGGASQSFNKKNLAATSTIPAQGFFLISNNSYSGGVPADISHNSFQTSSTGGNIFLSNSQDLLVSATSSSIIDKVAYGAGAYLFPETAEFLPAPGATESIERKSSASSTAQSLEAGADKWQGNGYDADNNSQDFILQLSPTPQNSQSLAEPRNLFPSLASDTPWPTLQQNEKHQGQTGLAPATTTVQTLVNSGSIIFRSPPVIGQNRIYIGASNGLYAFDLSGNQIWFYPGAAIFLSPLISSDGTVFARSDDGLYAFSDSGSLKWKYLISGNYYSSSLNIDKNGNVYIISSGKLYSFYPDGKVKWIFDASVAPLSRAFAGKIGAPAIDNLNEKIYINIDKYLYAVDFGGNLIWDFQNSVLFPTSPTKNFNNPAIGNDGFVYIGSAGTAIASGGFYRLSPNGAASWFMATGYSPNIGQSPAISSDGNIYFNAVKFSGSAIPKLFAFDAPTGAAKWEVLLGDSNISSPIVAGGNIYVAAGREIRAYDALGNMFWHWNEGSGSYINSGFGAVDNNGNLYFAVNGKIYKIGN